MICADLTLGQTDGEPGGRLNGTDLFGIVNMLLIITDWFSMKAVCMSKLMLPAGQLKVNKMS